jgi:hypothetical protein
MTKTTSQMFYGMHKLRVPQRGEKRRFRDSRSAIRRHAAQPSLRMIGMHAQKYLTATTGHHVLHFKQFEVMTRCLRRALRDLAVE